MKVQVPYYYILSEYMLIGSVICHSISNTFSSESTEDLVRRQTLKCNSFCPFGFKTDVEGRYTCECLDPCASLLCLQGTKCVVVMPKSCEWEPCSPTPTCQEEAIVEVRPKDGRTPYWKDLSKLALGDDPALWWDAKSDVDVCSQPLPEVAVRCKRKRRRWYYSPMTGQCVRFMGCDTPGNNFGRKYYCKSKCRTKVLSEAQKKALENSPDVCFDSIPEQSMKCISKKRRWFFNARTGKCEKFMGCESAGNNFSRKLFCKTKCNRRRLAYKLLDKTVADSREQTPR